MSGSLDNAWVKMMKNELNDDLLFEFSASSSSDTEASDETIVSIKIDSDGQDDVVSEKKSHRRRVMEKQEPAAECARGNNKFQTTKKRQGWKRAHA